MKKLLLVPLFIVFVGVGCSSEPKTYTWEEVLVNCSTNKVVDIEIICKDGREGCSTKYFFDDGSVSLLDKYANSGKEVHNGNLCTSKSVKVPKNPKLLK